MNAEQHAGDDYRDRTWVGGAFRPLLIGLVAAGASAGPLAIVRALAPWPLGYVLPLALVVALEGVYSTLQLGRPQWRDRRGLLFRLGEFGTLSIVLRLASWVFSTGLPSAGAAAQWLRHGGTFFDTQFVLVGAMLLVSWGLAIGITGDFLELAIQADEYAARQTLEWGESRSARRAYRPTPRTEIVGRFAERWAWGGILLVVCAALARSTVLPDPQGILQVTLARDRLPGDLLAALLCYFLAGLLLLSQGRLAVLRGQWYNEGVTIGPSVVRKWHVSSVWIVLLIAGLAALVPLGSTGWLAPALGALIGAIVNIVSAIVSLGMALLYLALYPLRSLTPGPPAGPDRAAPSLVPPSAPAANPLPDWVGGALYWLLVVAVLGYLVYAYLNAHGVLSGKWVDRLQGPRSRWRHWWRARWASIRVTGAALRRRLRGRARLVDRPRPSLQAVGSLPPTARIRYYYLSALRTAGERGLVRPPNKTPSEFRDDLAAGWPASAGEIDDLTAAFLAARYDRRPLGAEEASKVQLVWQRLLAAVRGPREGGDRDA